MRSYRDKKKELAVFGERDERLEFLEKCLTSLDDFERDLMEKTCIDGVSLRGYARVSGFSRETITKERKLILELICHFFNKNEQKKRESSGN